jgi:cellulose biosynthesis protein BcsQ
MILDRAVVVANGKGGTGKTSLAAGLAATAATMGWRCLAVDLDPQGTLGRDLGHEQRGLGDGGRMLHHALVHDQPLRPVAGRRPGLDVVTAGPWTDQLADDLATRERAAGPAGLVPARDALTAVARGYDLVVFDTPPATTSLLDLAFASSRFLCAPVRFDPAGIDGLVRVDGRRRVLAASGVNPHLEVLGLVLFGFAVADRRLLRDTRRDLEALLDGVAPVFPTPVRESRRAARQMRAAGLVASEYLSAARQARPWWDAAVGDERFARNAAGLATDYWELTCEVLTRLRQLLVAEPLVPLTFS